MVPGDLSSHSCSISVSVVPGAMALTRMPSGPYVTAADSVRLLTARFVAPYTGSWGLPVRLPTLEVLTMAPRFAVARMAAISAFMASHGPLRLTAQTSSKSASDSWSIGPGG